MKTRVFLGTKTFHSLREQYEFPDCLDFEWMGVEFYYSELMEPYDIFSTDSEVKAYLETITPNRPPIATPMADGTIDLDYGKDIWKN